VCPLALQQLAAQAAAASGGAVPRSDSAAVSSLGAAERALVERLQRDVQACVLCDRVFSPASGERGPDAGALQACLEGLPACLQLVVYHAAHLLSITPPAAEQMQRGTARAWSTRSGSTGSWRRQAWPSGRRTSCDPKGTTRRLMRGCR
jgi:hypothetical protein